MNESIDRQLSIHAGTTAKIIAAFVSANRVPVNELPALIASVHVALISLSKAVATEPTGPEKPTAAQIKKSISHDVLVSFEDGKSYRALKRHLTLRGLSPEAYRAKWGLPHNYPMTSPSYSARRSEMAHAHGLGQQRRKATLKLVEAPELAPKARGRKMAAETA